jgi:probable rRNA maturation factor
VTPGKVKRRRELDLTVQYAVSPRSVPTRAQFRKWARAALARNAKITVRITGAREARALNSGFRNRDYATNVLTFVMSEKPLEGDLVLCAPVVTREARDGGKPLSAHYAHLTIHGLLHLQGYDHEGDGEAAVMERRESRIMAGLGFADPYAED